MSPGVSHALEQALAYYRAPALLAKAGQRPLPYDVIELLRLAAGDEAQAAQSAEASGESPQRVVEAAVFFVQQVMFSAEADDFRVLGVNPGAPAARMREHFRWLIRWLHPDRNADGWDSVYSDRVTRAWQTLRRGGALAGEGNAGPDAGLPAPSSRERAEAAQKPTVLATARLARISRETPAAPPMVSARTARHLPAFVMGALGLAAVSLVALLWYAQVQKAQREVWTADAPAPRVDAAPAEPPAAPVVDVARGVDSFVPAQETSAATPVPVTAASQPPARLAAAQPAPPLPRSPAPPPARQPAANALNYVVPAPPAPAPVATVATVATVTKPDPAFATAAFAPQTNLIPQDSARALLSQFADAYIAGDITMLMGLFSRDATNNRGGRDAIAYDYESLFAKSRERRLTLWPNGWVERDSEVVVLATYEAWVKDGRVLPGNTTRGSIRFTLRRENGALKISRVMHE